MTEGREYELKFAIAPDDVPRLLANPGVPSPDGVTRLRSTYFDTDDAILRRHGVSLRVRRSGDALIHTVKRTGASIVDREEWEREGTGATPDLAWLRTTPLKRLFGHRVARDLKARFTVDVERATFALARGDATIEGALDRGTIETPAGSLPISEFELELKAGDPEAVLALARDLAGDVPMTLSLASKSERGYGRAEPDWGHATKVLPLKLRKGMTLAEAFEAMIQACLRLLLANAALVGTGADADAVHKARVALRRLRAALDLFAPVLRRRWRRTILADVKWLSATFGAARDADVFLDQVAAGASDQVATGAGTDAHSDAHGARELVGVMGEAKRATRRTLRAALASPRWRLFLLDLLDASRHGVRRRARHRRLRPFLHARLAARRRTLGARARHVARLSPEARHDVRKRAKILRYACDFAGCGAGLAPRSRSSAGKSSAGKSSAGKPSGDKPFRRLVDDLQVLQETLGALHDREALNDRLRTDVLGRGSASGAVTAAAERVVTAEVRSRDALREARHASRRVRRSKACA